MVADRAERSADDLEGITQAARQREHVAYHCGYVSALRDIAAEVRAGSFLRWRPVDNRTTRRRRHHPVVVISAERNLKESLKVTAHGADEAVSA
jgi:hypothetical protein